MPKVILGVFFVWYMFFSLPDPLFTEDNSTIVYSKENVLLGGIIAKDGQWRFPLADSISYKMEQCMVYFEDEYFNYHIGFNPISLGKALLKNIKHNSIKSGGSTITMQTIRLAKKNPPRTYSQKLLEVILATRLELRYSKNEILNTYLSHAPFGGNVVGIEAASWRYYKRRSSQLSWAESATLAVLPNAPSLIYPGKNQLRLKKKRNRLLLKLFNHKIIDKSTYELALEEPIPQKPNRLPQTVPHLMQLANKQWPGECINSTINNRIQSHVNETVQKHHWQLSRREIHNMAAIVIEVKTGDILAYSGNTIDPENLHSNRVDIIQAPRSSGSILKPFLYQRMLHEGQLLPSMLLPDVPYKMIKNYYKDYDGAVRADEALARSLNIPAVHLLQTYGVPKFKNDLKEYGFKHFTKKSDHYGLSLIIGGGEITLFELGQAYANMAYQLEYNQSKDMEFIQAHYNQKYVKNRLCNTWSDPNATYLTFDALKKVIRPSSETGWQNFNTGNISWKTGTSNGFRDAWAVGITPEHVVAIWVGNADGEGRPELTGTKVAAPILFDVFNGINSKKNFERTKQIIQKVKVCKASGYRWSKNCEEHAYVVLPKFASRTPLCPYHRVIFLDKQMEHRVNSSCYPVHQMVQKKQFILPPKMAVFYQKKNPFYPVLPTFAKGCINYTSAIDLIYPKALTEMFIPTDMAGAKQNVVFEAVHSSKRAILFWHIDDEFIKQTQFTHKIEAQPSVGKHVLTITDLNGNEISRTFRVVK